MAPPTKVNVEDDSAIERVGDVLSDKTQPIARRTRALFTLKAIGDPRAIDQMARGYRANDSELLLHEICYCVGQMGLRAGVPFLSSVLEGESEPVIARHEAGEAIGAIGSSDGINVLLRYSGAEYLKSAKDRVIDLLGKADKFEGDPKTVIPEAAVEDVPIEIRETCELAVERIMWVISGVPEGLVEAVAFGSVDPSPAYGEETTVAEACKILRGYPGYRKEGEKEEDEKEKGKEDGKARTLFERYCALFSLRNAGGDEAIDAICEAMESDPSALMRHEAAFVLGQMRDPKAGKRLAAVAQDAESQCGMVRHEAAEAMGAVANEECHEALRKIENDGADVVRESVEVALDVHEYEVGNEVEFGILKEVQ